ncbi:MAG: group III truncated hemoglobin [Bacteroidia bacterium]
MELRDIENYEDIELLVSAFYDKLLDDPITKDKFQNLDIKAHLPRIVDFWAFILLDKPGFTGNVFDKHASLNLEPIHFERWIEFWVSSINAMFKGPKSELAVQRAMLLSYTFQSKLYGNDGKKIL